MSAILCQNSAWKSTENALKNLQNAGLMNVGSIAQSNIEELMTLLQGVKFAKTKTKRIIKFAQLVEKAYNGSIAKLLAEPLQKLIKILISIQGMGRTTADSIILFSAAHPVFVVDSHTKRMLRRHHLIEDNANYQMIQNMFLEGLPEDIKLYHEYYALLAKLASEY